MGWWWHHLSCLARAQLVFSTVVFERACFPRTAPLVMWTFASVEGKNILVEVEYLSCFKVMNIFSCLRSFAFLLIWFMCSYLWVIFLLGFGALKLLVRLVPCHVSCKCFCQFNIGFDRTASLNLVLSDFYSPFSSSL